MPPRAEAVQPPHLRLGRRTALCLARAWPATARAGRRCTAARSRRPRERRARPASPPRRWTRSAPARRRPRALPATAASGDGSRRRERGCPTRPRHRRPARGSRGTGRRVGVARRRRDHRGVVRAELERREARVRERSPERRVRRDAADDGDPLEAGLLGGLARPAHERPHDRVLVRGREIGLPALDLLLSEVAQRVEERGLEPREREVEAVDAGDREPECLWIAVLREPVDRGTARVAEPEEPRALVERLACGVVERRAEPLRPAALAHGEQERVTAAGEQAEERRLERDPARDRATRRARRDGRPGRAGRRSTTRSPWRPRGRRAARRRVPGPA